MDLIAYMIHIGSMIVKFVVFIANMLHFEYQTSPQAIHFVFCILSICLNLFRF